MSTLHERLRRETRPLHDDVEAAVDVMRQVSSRRRYAAYLSRLWRVHRAAENDLCARDFSGFGFSYEQQRRSTLIEADLVALGFPLGSLGVRPLPPVPELTDLAEALGAVYVIEGSALGARALLPEITKSIGFDAGHGASFFAAFGGEGKAIWTATLNALRPIAENSARGDHVVAGAVKMFEMYRQHLVETDTSKAEAGPG